MGLKLGRVLGKSARLLPGVMGGFAQAGPMGAGMFLGQTALTGLARTRGGVGAGVPTIQAITGVAPLMRFAEPVVQGEGLPVAGQLPAIIAGMNRITAMAIARLAAALAIPFSLASIGRVGMRIMTSVMAFARRHPAASVIGLLTGLGLLAEEAAHLIGWFATKKRRRRGRGISARDIRVCRRTMRKMSAFQHDLGRLPHHHARRAIGRGGGVSVVRAG